MVEAAIWQDGLLGGSTAKVDVTKRNGNEIYATTLGRVYLLEAATGKRLNSVYLGDYGVEANKEARLHSYQDSMLIVGCNGKVFGLHPTTLHKIWGPHDLKKGDGIVNVGVRKGVVYAACNGHIFTIKRETGELIAHDGLPNLGNGEVRFDFFADEYDKFAVGAGGNIWMLELRNLTQVFPIPLVGCSKEVVNLICHEANIYAASNTYLYMIKRGERVPSVATRVVPLDSREKFEVRMTIAGNHLITAGYGFVQSWKLHDLYPGWKKRIPNVSKTDVSVIKAEIRTEAEPNVDIIYAGCTDYVFGLNSRNGDIVSECRIHEQHRYEQTRLAVNGPNVIVGNAGRATCSPLSIYEFDWQRQEQTHWCWAAMTAAVSLYYDPSSIWTQCRLANAVEGRKDCCEDGGSPECNIEQDAKTGLEKTGNFHSETTEAALPQQIADEMRQLRPIVAGVFKSGQPIGHAVVIQGFYPATSEAQMLVKVCDSSYGESLITYETLRLRYQGEYLWLRTQITKPEGAR